MQYKQETGIVVQEISFSRLEFLAFPDWNLSLTVLLVPLAFWVRFKWTLAYTSNVNCPVTPLTHCFCVSAFNTLTLPLYWGSPSHFLLYKHPPFYTFDSMTPQNSLCTRLTHKGYCNTLSMEGMVLKVRQITAMNYTRNPHKNLEQFHVIFHAQNCVLLSTQSFLSTWRCIKEVLFIQGPFDKIQGLLGRIQALKQTFQFSRTFQGVDAFSRKIQGPFEPWNDSTKIIQ